MGITSRLKSWQKVSQKVGGEVKSRSGKVSDDKLSDFPKKLLLEEEV
jgi:hypothetical protein